jgi:hypothetical protein
VEWNRVKWAALTGYLSRGKQKEGSMLLGVLCTFEKE